MKGRFKRIFGIDFKNIILLLIGDLFYRFVILALLMKLSSIAINIGLKAKGYSYLTSANVIKFFTSPLMILMSIVILIIALFLILVETSALVIGLAEAEAGNRLSWGRIIFGAVKGINKLMHKSYLLLMIPGTLVQVLLIVWIRVRYVYEIGKADISYGVMAVIVILATAAFVAQALVSCMIVQEMNAKKSWRTMCLVFKKQKRLLLAELAAVNLIIPAAAVALYFLLVILTTIIVGFTAKPYIQLAMVLTIRNYIVMVVTIVGLNVAIIVNMCIISHQCIPQFFTDDGRSRLHCQYWLSGYQYSFFYKHRIVIFIIFLMLCTALLGFSVWGSVRTGSLMAEKSLAVTNITSHRGASQSAPENTLPAIKAAIESMADYVEIDVQETLDGEVVLMHDLSLKRTAGEDAYVADLTLNQIKRYDVGYWFGQEYAGTRVPTLEEVFQLADGRISFNIEIKRSKSGGDLAEKVVALIKEYGIEDKVVISSSDYRYLLQVKELNNSLTTGYILTTLMGGNYNDKNIDFYSIKYSFVSPSVVNSIHSEGKGVHVWTVNARSAIERMKKYGVDNIITDNPVLTREVMYNNDTTKNIYDILKLSL